MIRHLLKVVWSRKRANALVTIEILFCFVVVAAVITTAVALIANWNRPVGYEWKDVWVIRVSTTGSADGPSAEAGFRAGLALLMRELKSFPEVVDAALSDTPAYGNATSEGRWQINGRTVELTRDQVSDGFANVMLMKPIRGRWFSPADDALSFVPVVIDADLARDLYGSDDPVGKKFDEINNTIFRVVGVVPPYRKTGEFSAPQTNMAFFRKSLTREEALPRNVLIRVRTGTPADFEAKLQQHIHTVAPDISFGIERMSAMRDRTIRERMTPLIVITILAGFLIAMVALGLTGVLWQTVTSRTRELGLRRALGASSANVRAQVVIEVALLVTAAVIIGLALLLQLPLLGIFALVRPSVFATGIIASLAVIYAITLLCGAYPSWLASKIQPAEALHYE